MTNDNDVTRFYSNILENPQSTDMDEVVEIIKHQSDSFDFYNLCQKYVDIALNAMVFIDKESSSIGGIYKFDDVNIAAEDTKSFVDKYNISDVDCLLTMIKNRYFESKSRYDTRKRTQMVQPKNTDDTYNSVGYFGTLIDKADITAWNEVKEHILNFIETEQ